MLAEAVLSGWWVGYAIGIVAITAVVVLVAMILTLARRIGLQAIAITEALEDSRVATMGLWNLDKANHSLRSIVKGARQARGVLEGTP